MRKRVKSMTHRLWSNLVEGLSCDGLSATCFIQPTQSGCPMKRGTWEFHSYVSFFFSHEQQRTPIIVNSSGRPEAIGFYSKCNVPAHELLCVCCLKCNNPWLANECLAMGNNGNLSHHVSTLKENKLSIDAIHHQLIITSSQHGITQKMQFIFNRYPSIIQINGIVRHPI